MIQQLLLALLLSLCAFANSEAYSWGKGTNGRLGNGDTQNQAAPVLVDQSSGSGSAINEVVLAAISAGVSHTLVLGKDYNVYSFGAGGLGQLGFGGTADQKI